MLTTATIIATLALFLQVQAHATPAVYCTSKGQFFCTSPCSRTIHQCTGPNASETTPLSDPTLVCIPGSTPSSPPTLGFWHTCKPPTKIEPQASCKTKGQIHCPEDCGSVLIKCTGDGLGYSLVMDDKRFVCSRLNGPSYIDSIVSCVNCETSTTSSAHPKPTATPPAPMRPPTPPPIRTPSHIAAPTPTPSLMRTPTPTATPVKEVTRSPASTVTVVASTLVAPATPAQSAVTTAAEATVVKADQVAMKSGATSGGEGDFWLFATFCVAGVLAAYLQV
ncbi:hypothetical protein HDU67_007825 [Dinochytrium kinnereticum]|nr:hypothetical protein HDU67_007825 [Dinochytrium kinnereticum]